VRSIRKRKDRSGVTTYQKMIEMGADQALRGYQGEVDAYRNAKRFDKVIEVSRKAVEANPGNREVKADAGLGTG